jgi:hypothetical protein
MFLRRSARRRAGSCRKCAITRGFLMAALPLMIILPLWGERMPWIADLTPWHFVALIWGAGLAGAAIKIMAFRRGHDMAEVPSDN